MIATGSEPQHEVSNSLHEDEELTGGIIEAGDSVEEINLEEAPKGETENVPVGLDADGHANAISPSTAPPGETAGAPDPLNEEPSLPAKSAAEDKPETFPAEDPSPSTDTKQVPMTEIPIVDVPTTECEAVVASEASRISLSTENVTSSLSSGLGIGSFRLGAWKKASGAASSLLSTAKESTLKNLGAMNISATITDFMGTLDDSEAPARDPLRSQESGLSKMAFNTAEAPLRGRSVPQGTSEPLVAERLTQLSQRPEDASLTEEEFRQVGALERLHRQFMESESQLETARQKQTEFSAEISQLKNSVEEKNSKIYELEQSIKKRVEDAIDTTRQELQREFVEAMTENEQRICDLKIVLRQREKRIEEFEQERETRANALEQSIEAQAQVAAELQMQKQMEKLLRNEIAAERETHQEEVDRLKKKEIEIERAVELLKARIEEVEERKRRSEYALSTAEMDSRQLKAQLTTMRSKLAGLNILERSVDEVSRQFLTPEEMEILSNCKNTDEVLALFKRSQILVTQLERKLAAAEAAIDAANQQAAEMGRIAEEQQTEVNRLREQLSAGLSSLPQTPAVAPTAEVDTSLTAVLEARLAAKSERVEALVCEVAQLRQQLTSPDRKLAVMGNPNGSFGLLDDGRDSLIWILVFLPLIQLVNKAKGPNIAHRWENRLRKISNRVSRHPTVLFIDQKLRMGLISVGRSKSSRFILMIYSLTVHLVLFGLFLGPVAPNVPVANQA
eukprot:Gregarina_sp_Poly_1__5093@NODE_269_length_10312_cov_190_473011_g234_i0_p2_GENE_NODE_269_length_10312_cov_190_473011_g234_i0NODE_269_length_10312_cov_190_473011_g234_i0_p2_ORF_typecomplete_len737_score140_26MAD/PF05557_13/1_1e07SlyX/PF04102_12/1_4e03SlyX/PF04102_12/1_1e04SlyX/PF04102_12/1_8e04SlyX/PF04102_12/2_9e03SlyX/PF04102_12/0_0021SlyX/PF04102_12/4_9HOOK/PF05622_12/2_4DUF3584/PF12128_8/3_5CENPF_leu_zip/PF10473_9/39CENPF_leu_zip/PF10473_9/6_6e03CENPF_leu_zip/PF10473_9/31CENPF_leu_zip/PF10473_